MKALGLCLIALTLPACGQAAAPAPVRTANAEPLRADTGFDRYWSTFRAAALARDMAKLSALSAFPVRSRGELDDDPVKLLTPASLPQALKRAFEGPADDSQTTRTPTMLDKIRMTPRLTSKDIDGGDGQRFGSLGFARVRGKWVLTTIYRGAD